MVLVLVIAHVVLTLPAFTINLIATFNIASVNEHFEGAANDIVILMFFANAALNPILYGVFNTNFQAAFEFCPCKKVAPTVATGLTLNPHSMRNSSIRAPSQNTGVKSTMMNSPRPNVKRQQLTVETNLNGTSCKLSTRKCSDCDDEIYSNNLNVPSVLIS